jgi:hypothetical protein
VVLSLAQTEQRTPKVIQMTDDETTAAARRPAIVIPCVPLESRLACIPRNSEKHRSPTSVCF